MPADTPDTGYVGRFAPTPSGPLHLGSMLAALASWLDARAHHGKWLLRMEDLDTPRLEPGAADRIQRQLEAYGLEWDGPVSWQSQRNEAYATALAQLEASGTLFYCRCSRRMLRNKSGDPAVYPGTCRMVLSRPEGDHAIRIRVYGEKITFSDRILGPYTQNLGTDVGDFVVKRRDHIFAYQLAVVVDDRDQGISDIVRGADIHDSTPRQIYLQHLLGATTPRYAHTPLLVGHNGAKLSKQNHAREVPTENARQVIRQLLTMLNMPPPDSVTDAPAKELLGWAIENWDVGKLQGFTPPPVTG